MGIHLKPFDPEQDFVTQGAFRAAGKVWGKGLPFDTFGLTNRALELLYNQRKIVYADSPEGQKLLGRTYDTKGREIVEAEPEDEDGLDDGGQEENEAPAEAQTEADESDEEALELTDEVEQETEPEIDDEAAAIALQRRYGKPDLQMKARSLPGYNTELSKPALAALLVRNGIKE